MHSVYNKYQNDIEIESRGAMRAEILIDSIFSGGHFGIQDDPHIFGRITCVPHFTNNSCSII